MGYLGKNYGIENTEGELEFIEAIKQHKTRLIFIKGADGEFIILYYTFYG